MRVLVTGWFSFDEVIATIGDQLGADVVVGWLAELGIDHDVAWAPYLGRGANWRELDPAGAVGHELEVQALHQGACCLHGHTVLRGDAAAAGTRLRESA